MSCFSDDIRKAARFKFCALFLFLFPFPLLAQNIYSVTNAAGDDTPGSLGAAVTGLNNSGLAGAITFNAVPVITLFQPLAPVSQTVSLQGASVAISGQNDAQAQFLFQQGVTQQVQFLTLENNGGLGTGLDLSVTAAGWSQGANDQFILIGADAASTQASPGGALGQSGGNIQAAMGTWTIGTNTLISINAGAGGAVSDAFGGSDRGGNGGSVSLGFNSMDFEGTELLVNAGNGGSVTNSNGTGNLGGNGGSLMVQGNSCTLGGGGGFTAGSGGDAMDLGSGAPQGGNGGSLDFSLNNNLTVSYPGGNFFLKGGLGGAGVTGGAGGAATLTAGSVTLSSILVVQGGNGGNGVSLSGAGGSALVSIGAINQFSNNLTLSGGLGGFSALTSGAGGDVELLAGTVTLSGTAALAAVGGAGGSGNFTIPDGPANGGNGGLASGSLGTLSLTGSGSNFQIVGGNGGSGTYGGDGGDGGNTAVTVGALSLNTGSGLTLTGGMGGGGGNGSGANGGNGGAGGSVSFVGGQVSLASGTTFLIAGASGGAGGTGILQGATGATGQAFATIGSLLGQGAISMTGSSALLQVELGNFSGVLGGNEVLDKTGPGSLTLSGANSYGGGTSISGGTLGVFSDAGLGASGTTLTLDGGALQADGAVISSRNVVITGNNGVIDTGEFSSAFSGIVSGAGGLLVEGPGSLNLSGANSYAGGTTVSGGTLGVSSDGSLGASATTLTLDRGTLLADANLASSRAIMVTGNNGGFNTGDFSSSLSGLVSGAGSLSVNGRGSVTLTNNNTYSGGTDLQGGTLACGVTQALGTGSVVVSGGTLESAGVPLPLSISGNYGQGPGGTLRLGVGGGQVAYFDSLNVAGSAGLNGTLSLYSYGGLTPPSLGHLTAVLLSSGPLSGSFQGVQENLGDTRLLPLYLSNALDLESIVPSFQALSATENEKAIGADLDSTVFNSKLTLMMSQLGVLSAGSLQTAEDQVSPEGLSALFQAGFEGALSRAALVDQRLSQFRDAQQIRVSPPGFSQSGTPLFAGNLTPVEEASMVAPQREGDWSGFLSGNGGIFNVAGDSNAAGYKVTTYGLTGAGADIRLSREFALGLMAGFSQSNISLDGSGTLTASGGQLGLYGLFASGGFYADTLVEGGIDQYTTLRQSYVGTATGQTPGQEWSGAMKLGYGWKVDPVTLGPMASLQYTRVGLNGFSESGSLSPLTYPTQSQDSLMSRLGLQIDGHLNLGSAVLAPEVVLAWEREYDDLGGNVEAGFGTGDSFTVAGPALGQSGVLAGAGVDLAFSKNFSVDLRYQGELNRTELNSQQFGGGMRLGF